MIKCVVIDDDRLFTRLMEHFLTGMDDIILTGVYNDSSDALAKVNFSDTDLLFLNAEMPGITGVDFLNSLVTIPPLILVSGKKIYAADAFEYNAIDYLHKPLSHDRFLKAMNKARQVFEKAHIPPVSNPKNIFIKHDKVHLRLSVDDIQLVRANDNDISIVTAVKTYKTHLRLKDIYSILPRQDFMQVHRSFIVQLAKIDKVDGEVIEVNKRTVPVSRTYINELYERLRIK
ncbi:MAG: LytR/AlgR family response regulator transcription factor [Bacteroidia bacterium]